MNKIVDSIGKKPPNSFAGATKCSKMEHFRSILPPPVYPFQLSHADHFLGIGSCFVEQMGQRLAARKFSSFYNPLGIAFNPYAVALSLTRARQPKAYQVADLFEYQGLWHSFDHHGSFSAPSSLQTLAGMDLAQQAAHAQFQKASVLILTLGTANVWDHLAEKRIVSNCHKLPGHNFQRRRMDMAETVEVLGTALEACFGVHPELKVIITVSPVRYLREGIIENARSKATLLLATEQLCRSFDQVYYFPAYELLVDDLRDYRFYAEDLAHPNAQATDYIWDYFKNAFFDAATQIQTQELEKLHRAVQHRPLHPDAITHQTFLHQQLEYIIRLESKYPSLDFSAEKSIFHQQLNS